MPHSVTTAVTPVPVNEIVPVPEKALPFTGPVNVPVNPVPLIVPLAVVPDAVPVTVPLNAVPATVPLIVPLIAPPDTVPEIVALIVVPADPNAISPLSVPLAHADGSVYNANAYVDPAVIENGVDVPANVNVCPLTVAGPRNGSCHLLPPGAKYAI